MMHVDIASKGEVFQYLMILQKKGQVRDCICLKISQDFASAFYPICTEEMASRVPAQNVDLDSTGYGRPSSYFWPRCPEDCPRYSKSIDFANSLITEGKDSTDSIKVTKEGVYFAGQYFDAIKKVQDILSTASKSIMIIDRYIGQNILDLLSSKGPKVEVKILADEITPTFLSLAKAFNSQYGNLSIRKSCEFHDRFLIIDDTEYYHFGASLKHLGHRGFMFSRIEESKVIDSLKREVVQVWQKAQIKI